MKYQIGHALQQEAAGKEYGYTLTGTFKHRNRNGYVVDVLVWCGSCATCGRSFEATTSAGKPRYLARTCTVHRRRSVVSQDRARSTATEV